MEASLSRPTTPTTTHPTSSVCGCCVLRRERESTRENLERQRLTIDELRRELAAPESPITFYSGVTHDVVAVALIARLGLHSSEHIYRMVLGQLPLLGEYNIVEDGNEFGSLVVQPETRNMGTAHLKPDKKLKPDGHPYVGALYATAAGPWILMGRIWLNRAVSNASVLLAHKEVIRVIRT